jgi:hypothetical protein
VDHPVPLRQLVAFERVSLDVGEAATVTFAIGTDQLTLTNNDGDRVRPPTERSEGHPVLPGRLMERPRLTSSP